jgi:hypothetical protein
LYVKLELAAATNSQRMPGERGDDFLDHAVGEVLLLRVAAQVLEWQHRDRRLVGQNIDLALLGVTTLG